MSIFVLDLNVNLMRKLFFILIVVWVLPCCVHQPKIGVRSLLEEAEAMLRTCPDTAYFLLREMETTMDLETKADSAYHGLLLLEALVKNDLELTDKHVASLEELTHYYREKQDSLANIRLLRLRAAMHSYYFCFDEAMKCYHTAIGMAERVGEKQLLADMYQESACMLNKGSVLIENAESLADSLFCLAERLAVELGDSILWMNALYAHNTIPMMAKDFVTSERMLLQVLDLAILLHDKEKEKFAIACLSVIYGAKGEKDKSLLYAKRNIALQKEMNPEYDSFLALSQAYQRIGEEDSAAFYLEKSRNVDTKKRMIVPSDATLKEQMKLEAASDMFIERMKQQKELERREEQTYLVYVLLGLVVLYLLYYIVKRRLRYKGDFSLYQTTEEQRKALETEKLRLTSECVRAKELLERKEQELQKEKEVLLCKEKEIERLQSQLEALSSDAVRVFDKIKQIIADYRNKSCSDLKLEEADWQQLQWVLDKRWNGAVSRSLEKYQLSETEVRLFCLNAIGVATVHIQFLLGIGRNGLYEMNRELSDKLGIERTSNTFKKDFQKFIENEK